MTCYHRWFDLEKLMLQSCWRWRVNPVSSLSLSGNGINLNCIPYASTVEFRVVRIMLKNGKRSRPSIDRDWLVKTSKSQSICLVKVVFSEWNLREESGDPFSIVRITRDSTVARRPHPCHTSTRYEAYIKKHSSVCRWILYSMCLEDGKGVWWDP